MNTTTNTTTTSMVDGHPHSVLVEGETNITESSLELPHLGVVFTSTMMMPREADDDRSKSNNYDTTANASATAVSPTSALREYPKKSAL